MEQLLLRNPPSGSDETWTTAFRTSESWETADEGTSPTDHEQVERTRRDVENEEGARPAKRLKSGEGEVYDETRERIPLTITYPHFEDPVDDVHGPDAQLDDRHFSGLWDIVRYNARKDATESQDENFDDGSSNSDGFSEDEECTNLSSQKSSHRSKTLSPQITPETPTILPSIEISPTGTNSDNSSDLGTNNGGTSTEQPYNDPTAGIVISTSNNIAGHYPRTPSPRHQPLISPAPYISPISPVISQFITSVPSFTFTPQAAHISPTSHLGSSTSLPPDLVPSASPYTSSEEGEEDEEGGEGEEGEEGGHWTLEREEEEQEWEGFSDDKQEEEQKGNDDLRKKKKKKRKVTSRKSIVFWRREAWKKERRRAMKSEEEEWEGFSDEEREGDTELEDEGSEDAHGGSSPTQPVSSSSPPAPPFHIRRFLRRNLRPRRHTDQTTAEGFTSD